jgi:ornithine cyclodeaminase/alanine dehydrogenase-like protein (mu-crystallin family)
MTILSAAEIASRISIDDCIAAVEQIFRRYGDGALAKPQSLGLQAGQGTFHVKAAATDVFVAKVNANFPDNPRRHGLPSIQGVIVVMDLEKGSLLGLLDSAPVTTMRTAAAAAVAAKYLARRDARTLATIGCGVQGKACIEAIARVRALSSVRVYDVDPDAARKSGGLVCSSIEEAVAGADIIVTCTPSRQPILDERHAAPGAFIAAIGADNPAKNEISPSLMARARVVPDSTEQAASMGDLHHAVAAGTMTAAAVHGELGAVIAGRVPARRSDHETFIFDSTGTALQDVAVASLLLQRC